MVGLADGENILSICIV